MTCKYLGSKTETQSPAYKEPPREPSQDSREVKHLPTFSAGVDGDGVVFISYLNLPTPQSTFCIYILCNHDVYNATQP
ncbi:predicted protein [Botrytis cinerea T4]|uniref:Uncharacterized protein n=1 Tax=Botryotinia fuckeliana (strain T4) TaxID=999810 RepID=G2Y1P2_BOTF4|nr:predicted protein [Botrytis cinerea T4]